MAPTILQDQVQRLEEQARQGSNSVVCMQAGRESVTATKLLGVDAMPSNTVVLRADIGRDARLPIGSLLLEELGVTARYKAQVRWGQDHVPASSQCAPLPASHPAWALTRPVMLQQLTLRTPGHVHLAEEKCLANVQQDGDGFTCLPGPSQAHVMTRPTLVVIDAKLPYLGGQQLCIPTEGAPVSPLTIPPPCQLSTKWAAGGRTAT